MTLIERLMTSPALYTTYQGAVRRGGVIERTLQNEIGVPRGPVLDFACGSGLYAPLFDPLSYVGVDISHRYLRYASRRNGAHRFGAMDIRQLAMRSASMTTIVAVGVLHHFDDEGARAALSEARRVLVSDGRMIIVDLLPALSRYNVLGRALVRLDRGQHPRTFAAYRALFDGPFVTRKDYTIRTGPYDLGVFVLQASARWS